MNLREDEKLLEMIDALCVGNEKTMELLLNHLFNNYWNKEIGQKESILVAIVSFMKHYNSLREQETDIQTSLDSSIAHILSNPNIQALFADMMSKQLGGRFQ